MIKKYRKRPVEVEAIFYTGKLDEIIEFIPPHKWACISGSDSIILKVAEGELTIKPMTWIIKEQEDLFYPVRPKIFEITYYEVKN